MPRTARPPLRKESPLTVELYGIPNCDTVKKARAWLDEKGVAYTFHDYKKEGADADRLKEWTRMESWEKLLNRRGTTFRTLPEADKTEITSAKAIALMHAHPSLIKRPVVETGEKLLVGFDEPEWDRTLA